MEHLLQVYGHIDLIALEEVDALDEKITPLRVISDAVPTHGPRIPLPDRS